MPPRRHLGGRGLGGRGIGQRSTSAGFSPTTALLAAPATPTLTLTTGATDNTPGFQFDGAIVELDTVRFQYDTHSDFSAPSDITNAIDAAEDAANQLIFSTGSLADGTWYFRARIERPLHFPSLWSNTETETIDTMAPTLSSVVGTKTGQTTANLDFSTNEGNGTAYVVVTTSATDPTKTQVKTGKDHTGASAAFAASQAVVSTGAQSTIGATGLSGGTTYYEHVMHEDAVGNQSNVSASSAFTTDAASGPTQVRATFKAGALFGLKLDHASIGVQNANEATASAPVELLFSGGHGFNISSGATIVSDWATLTVSSNTGSVHSNALGSSDNFWSGYSIRTLVTPVTGGSPLIVIMDVNAAATPNDDFATAAGQLWYQAAAATYNQAAPGGSWTSYAHYDGVILVETQ